MACRCLPYDCSAQPAYGTYSSACLAVQGPQHHLVPCGADLVPSYAICYMYLHVGTALAPPV